MLNYEIDPDLLRDRVPAGTELDSWKGRFFVSMVGFQFTSTRLFGFPIPLHTDFDEVHLRFYVRRSGFGGSGGLRGPRRGVVFVKEIVPKPAIAWIARWLYNENYIALRMAHDDCLHVQSDPRLSYRWWLGDSMNEISLRPTGDRYLPQPGSEEEFITEHYWGYVQQRDGTTLEYQVEHPQWEVLAAVEAKLRCDVARIYGPEFEGTLSAEPSSAFIALGSPVVVRRGGVIRAEATDRSIPGLVEGTGSAFG